MCDFRSCCLLAIAAFLSLGIAHAEATSYIYKWNDADGGTVISNRPPVGHYRNLSVIRSSRLAMPAPPRVRRDAELQALNAQVAELQNELAEERRARTAVPYVPVPIPASSPPMWDACAEGSADCPWISSSYLPGVLVGGWHFAGRLRHFQASRGVPHTAAFQFRHAMSGLHGGHR